MPNPHPPIRRRAASSPDELPPYHRRMPDGRIEYRRMDPRTRTRRSLYGWTLDEIARQLETPAPVAHDARLLLRDYLRTWAAARPGEVRSNTAATDAENVERYLVPYFQELRLVELSPEHVRAFMRHMHERRTRAGRPLAPRTIAIARGTLRKACAAAVPHRIGANPVPPPDKVRERERRIVGRDIAVPGVDELRAIEHELRTTGDRLYPLFLVASTTGTPTV